MRDEDVPIKSRATAARLLWTTTTFRIHHLLSIRAWLCRPNSHSPHQKLGCAVFFLARVSCVSRLQCASPKNVFVRMSMCAKISTCAQCGMCYQVQSDAWGEHTRFGPGSSYYGRILCTGFPFPKFFFVPKPPVHELIPVFVFVVRNVLTVFMTVQPVTRMYCCCSKFFPPSVLIPIVIFACHETRFQLFYLHAMRLEVWVELGIKR